MADIDFCNGKADCGCKLEYVSGNGEYSDGAYVTLCAEHKKEKEIPMDERGFWMVWCNGGLQPTVKHDTEAEAVNEAGRLARKHLDKKFFVLRTVKEVRVPIPDTVVTDLGDGRCEKPRYCCSSAGAFAECEHCVHEEYHTPKNGCDNWHLNCLHGAPENGVHCVEVDV